MQTRRLLIENVDVSSRWQIKALFLMHIFLLILLSTWFIPVTERMWQLIDQKGFYFLNSFLAHPFWQNFWGCANHKKMDWIHDLFMLAFFVFYIKKGVDKREKFWRVSQLIACTFLFALIIFTINKSLIPAFVQHTRSSPSLIYETTLRLSKMLDWLTVKDYSRSCFPADHGTTAALFVITVYRLMDKKTVVLSLFYGTFFCLPRLIVGAHFITDIIFGSVPIAVFSLGWIHFSPLFYRITFLINKFLTALTWKKEVYE